MLLRCRRRLPWSGLGVLFVHAHPDDEASATALTAALAARRGARTALVCLTTGDRGGVVDPELRTRVAWGRPSPECELRRLRAQELASSARILGFDRLIQLGYGDSGMPGSPDSARETCLWQAWRRGDPRPVARLVRLIRRMRPQVVVTYDPDGGYGHPDHVATHHLTTAAVGAAADPGYRGERDDPVPRPLHGVPHQVAKLYHCCVPASVGEQVLAGAGRAGVDLQEVPSAGLYYSGTVPDAEITTTVEAGRLISVKQAALRAHRSQISPEFPLLWDLELHPWLRPVAAREHFRLAATWGLGGTPPPGAPADHLFGGLAAGLVGRGEGQPVTV
ncbi:MAG TPA: PIG-L family deacetylase [Candidatus Dormibacteraeota bacterium]|nr:PIG-L family deacetylase [Candidatus Dormibacteraeota bacterium]